jgi:hypothetical protein
MSKKRFIWTLVVIILILAGLYGYKEYTRTNKKLTKVHPDFSISADSLISEFEKADSVAYQKYDDKVIEVTGVIKNSSMENFIILLGDPGKLSAVKCELDTSFRKDVPDPVIGAIAVVKGHFVGFQKDELMGLGTDVNLNRCVFAVKIKE